MLSEMDCSRFEPGDLVRVDFCDRTAVILSYPQPVVQNDEISYQVSIRWHNGSISKNYNTDYLELIRAAR